MNIQQIHVRKDDISDANLVHVGLPDLPDGAVRLKIESFSITSNNVTYAVVGDGFKYWDFFPAPDGFGIVPVWGHAQVVESNHPDIAVGERVYGYLPMATHLDVFPGKISASGFADTADHRQLMSPIYNQYTRLSADPDHEPAREGERMIFGPLFKTGFLIEYFMRDQEWFGAEKLILTSASSKTAMGLASVAKQRSPQIKRVGLTSAANVEFVEATGLYDQVYGYESVGLLTIAPSVLVDFAGNAALLAKVHEHFGDTLRYSCLVGATHVDERGSGGLTQDRGLPGPTPTLFFAPDHAVSFFQKHGPAEGGKLVGESWRGFLDAAKNTVQIETRKGLGAAETTFVAMARGEVDPAQGIVIEL